MHKTEGKKENPNGRPKGSPNKTTQSVREWLTRLIDDNREQIRKDLAALEPKERLQVLEKFMQYTVPKMQSVEARVDIDRLSDSQIDQVINELSEKL